MKKSELKKIIKEEIREVLTEYETVDKKIAAAILKIMSDRNAKTREIYYLSNDERSQIKSMSGKALPSNIGRPDKKAMFSTIIRSVINKDVYFDGSDLVDAESGRDLLSNVTDLSIKDLIKKLKIRI